MRSKIALIAALGSLGCLLGCGDKSAATATTATASASAAPKKSKLVGFTAKVDDKELILDSALAFSRGGSALHITLSTHPIPCDKIAGAGFKLEPGEFVVDFTLAPVFQPGGKIVWKITGSRLGDVTRQGALGDVTVLLADPRRTVKIELDDVALVFPPTKLVLDGTLVAAGCGVIPLTERAKVRPQKAMRVELNGKRRVINGASVATIKGKRTLRLTTEPHACDKGVQGSDMGIAIALAEDGSAESLTVTGFGIPRPLRSKPGMLPANVQFDEAGQRALMDVAISSDLELGKDRLVMDGVARVEICP